MKNSFLTLVVLLLSANYLSAQYKTYFGIEGAVTNDIYHYTDIGHELISVPDINGLWGFHVRQDMKWNLYLEAGLIRKYYTEGFTYKDVNPQSYFNTTGINAWIIPLRAGYKIRIIKDILSLVPVVGYSFGINTDYGYGSYGGGAGFINNVSDFYVETSLRQYYSLLQMGLGFDITLFKKVVLSADVNYYTGFNDVVLLDIRYSINNSIPFSATGMGKGEFMSAGLGIKYPVSNFWMKKK